MASVEDSLLTLGSIDRVHYETGVLLNDEDFVAEQNYHRGRLARALQYVVGSGTVAGLRVIHEEALEGEAEIPASEEKIKVEPGLALDSYGRLIELPRHYCMRLNRWYEQQASDSLKWHDVNVAWPGSPAGVIVDLHIQFVSCPRGKTPSFAVGPFDSIDAVTTARIRDSATLSLHLRSESNPVLAKQIWPEIDEDTDAAIAATLYREAIMDAWKSSASVEQSVFLARMLIAAEESEGEQRPQRVESGEVQINNGLRQFVVSTNALMSWLNIDVNEGSNS